MNTKDIATKDLVAFGEYGSFRLLHPGLVEIVDCSTLDMVSGGNYGCLRVGNVNSACNNYRCFNNVCIQNLCG